MPNKTTLGQIFILLSCLFFAIMALLVKVASGSFSGVFISLFRFIIGLIVGGTWLAFNQEALQIRHKKTLLARAVIGTVAMVLYFIGIQMTGSGRATLLINTFPIFVALYGYLFFHEKIGMYKVVSIIICVIGVGFVFYDGSSYSVWGSAAAFSAAILRGMAVHLIRKSAQYNHPLVVYLVVCVCGLILIPVSGHEAANLTWTVFWLLVLIGVLSLVAQLFMTFGFKYIPALQGSLLSYLAIPLTMLFGYAMGEELRLRFFVGTFLIIIGLLIYTIKGSRNAA